MKITPSESFPDDLVLVLTLAGSTGAELFHDRELFSLCLVADRLHLLLGLGDSSGVYICKQEEK